MTAPRAPRTVLAQLPLVLALAVGCGGADVSPTAPEAASPEPTAAAPTTAPASDPPAAKPAEEPAPVAQEAPDAPCEVKPGAAAAAAKGPKLELSIDRAKVDLEGKRLEVKLSRPACKVVLKVLGESGSVLANVSKPFDGASAGSPLMVGWSPSRAENVSRIEVWGHDTAGFYVGVAITLWNLNIPHEEVNFETDSDAIRASEVPKLEASLQKVKDALTKYKDLGNISLFIEGHTDSVGSAEHNLALSRRRARSIAGWFRGRGLKIPISYEGLGEYSLLVKTADETAEPRNRRVDYILSLEPLRLPTGSVTFGWKGL